MPISKCEPKQLFSLELSYALKLWVSESVCSTFSGGVYCTAKGEGNPYHLIHMALTCVICLLWHLDGSIANIFQLHINRISESRAYSLCVLRLVYCHSYFLSDIHHYICTLLPANKNMYIYCGTVNCGCRARIFLVAQNTCDCFV